MIGRAVAGVFGVALYSLITVALPIIIFLQGNSPEFGGDSSEISYQGFLYLYFVLYFIFNGLLNCYTLEPKRMKFICVKLMRMDAYEYSVATYFTKKLWNIIASLPSVILISLMFGGTAKEGILLCIMAKMFGFFGESIHLLYFHKLRKLLHKNYYIIFPSMILLLAAAYIPVIMKRLYPMDEFLFHPIFVLLVLILGVLGAYYILHYTDYKEGINCSNSLSDIAAINVKEVKKETRFADVKLKEKEFTKEELESDRYKDKKGYDYLNALFFNRHRKQIFQPVLRRLLVIACAIIIGVIGTFFIESFSNKFESILLRIYPLLVFFMYFISTVVQRATKAMFYNCDMSLLHYGFYKKGNVLLHMFWIRLKYLAGLNLLPAIAIALGLWLLTYLNQPQMMMEVLPVMAFVLVLSLFFTVHHVFLYYILQPYTTELGMKSPVYSIVNTIVYFVCWVSIQIEVTPSGFFTIVMAATIIYSLAALFLVYKFAQKTFNVK
jgi:hypothetical protein